MLCPSATSDEEQLRSKSREESSADASPTTLTFPRLLASALNANAQRVAQQAQERHQPRRTRRAPRGFPRDARRVARDRTGWGRERGRDGERRRRRFRVRKPAASGSIRRVGRSRANAKARFDRRRARTGKTRGRLSRPRGDGSVSGAKFGFVVNPAAARDERPGSGAYAAATAAAPTGTAARRPGRASREWPRSRRRRPRRSSPGPRAARRTPPTRPRTSASLGEGNRSPYRSRRPLRVRVVARPAPPRGGGGVQTRKPLPRALERGGPRGTSPCSVRRARLWRWRRTGAAHAATQNSYRDAHAAGNAVRRRTCSHAPRQRRQAPSRPSRRRLRRATTDEWFLNPSLWPVPEPVAVGAVARGGIAGCARSPSGAVGQTRRADNLREQRTAAGRGSYRAAGARRTAAMTPSATPTPTPRCSRRAPSRERRRARRRARGSPDRSAPPRTAKTPRVSETVASFASDPTRSNALGQAASRRNEPTLPRPATRSAR